MCVGMDKVREFLPAALSIVDFGVVVEDRNFNVVYMNDWLVERFGDCRGKKCYKSFINSDQEAPCERCPIINLLHKNGRMSMSYRQRGVDGKWYSLDSTRVPKEENLIMEMVREVTSDVELEKEAELLRLASHRDEQPLIITDEKFNIKFANASVAELLMRTANELYGSNAIEILRIPTEIYNTLQASKVWEGPVHIRNNKVYVEVMKLSNEVVFGYYFKIDKNTWIDLMDRAMKAIRGLKQDAG